MDLTNWAANLHLENLRVETFQVGSWEVTPLSVAVSFALLVLVIMGRRLSRPAGPKMESRDVTSAALITVTIGAAFLWIFAGLGLLGRVFH
jgi:hypothetical protein